MKPVIQLRKLVANLFLLSATLLMVGAPVSYGLAPAQKRVLQSGSDYFNIEESSNLRCGPGSNVGGTPSSNKVFFIGDSLTVGLGLNGGLQAASEAGFSVDTSYERLDTGWNGGSNARLKGKSIEANGGFGLRNATGIDLYDKLEEHKEDFSPANAGIIVIGMGTNDNVNGSTAEAKHASRVSQMLEFIDYIRSNNPTALLFWVNTYYETTSITSWEAINASIDEAASQKGVTVLDYASAALTDSSLAQWGDKMKLHNTPASYREKTAWILSQLPGGSNVAAPNNVASNNSVDIEGLTEDQKIAQTFMLGVTSAQADKIPALVEKYKLGGIYILGGSGNDVFNSTYFESLHSTAGIPLIIASDEEGGQVQRFRDQIGSFPSAAELGTKSNEEVELSAKNMADKLKSLGINTVLAPVADLALDGSGAVTELDRGFSPNPATVIEKADAFTSGIESAGLSATFKHFPGLGSTATNTDFGVGESPHIDTLRDLELTVYPDLIQQHPKAFLMLNNAIVPGVTGDGEVFTTTSAGVNIARNEYGFSGVIFTDSLAAEGVKEIVGDVKTAVAKSLAAGVDMPLFQFGGDGSDLNTKIQEIINHVKNQGVDVSASLQRIVRHKTGINDGGGFNTCGGAGFADPSSNPGIVWNFLAEKGLELRAEGFSPVQIAGFMGNLQAESGGTWDPQIVQYGKISACGQRSVAGKPSSLCPTHNVDGDTGYGIVQWTTRGRQQNLLDAAAAAGSIDNSGTIISGVLDIQLDFLWQELSTSYNNSVLKPIMQETDLRQATHIVLWNFECPRTCVDAKEKPSQVKPGDGRTYQQIYDDHLDSRTAYSMEWLTKFGSQ